MDASTKLNPLHQNIQIAAMNPRNGSMVKIRVRRRWKRPASGSKILTPGTSGVVTSIVRGVVRSSRAWLIAGPPEVRLYGYVTVTYSTVGTSSKGLGGTSVNDRAGPRERSGDAGVSSLTGSRQQEVGRQGIEP